MTEWWVKYQGHIPSVGINYPEEDWLEIRSQHGLKLMTYRFHNPEPRGIIFLFHGMHCASIYFTHLAKKFFEEGYAVVAFDQEGHGKSEGPRGNIISLEDYSLDCEKFVTMAKTHYPFDTPIYLLGHSMGGALSVMLALKRPELIRGILLFAPAIGIDPNFEPFLQKLVRCLNSCCPGIGTQKIDQKLASNNPYYPGYFADCPDYYSEKVNARTFVAMMDGMKNLQLVSENVTTPLIILQGGQDKITSHVIANEFYKKCKSIDKEYVFYEEMYHTIPHEKEIGEILDKCINWINTRS